MTTVSNRDKKELEIHGEARVLCTATVNAHQDPLSCVQIGEFQDSKL